MKKIWLIIPILLLVIACGEEPLIGNWERFGDDAEGTLVQVEKVGKTYHGKVIKVSGILEELGFAEKDIKWRDIESVRPNKWKGKDLIKNVDAAGNIVSVEYKDVYFTLLLDGTLEIRKFAKEQEIVGTVQKWRRIQ
ncbi:hypothetical protein KAT67_04070 [candidate division WOR-3 bacterium]|jgi:hypothetical protein|nr:hypothetical protein [candidate division WOR-3 bacterium]